MSELIWLDMYTLDAGFGVSPHDILSAIKDLENGEPETGIKPLKGLWHKHYFSAHFVAKNILLGFGTAGLRKLRSWKRS
jgi:hypothetical protein